MTKITENMASVYFCDFLLSLPVTIVKWRNEQSYLPCAVQSVATKSREAARRR